MAMRMTKEQSLRARHRGLFDAARGRSVAEQRAVSALFYYFLNMQLARAPSGGWNLEYKGQKYFDWELPQPQVWRAALEAAQGREYDSFLSWYDGQKARLAGKVFEAEVGDIRIEVPLFGAF